MVVSGADGLSFSKPPQMWLGVQEVRHPGLVF